MMLSFSIPRCSMYGIFTYISLTYMSYMVNVGKYSSPMEHLGLGGFFGSNLLAFPGLEWSKPGNAECR